MHLAAHSGNPEGEKKWEKQRKCCDSVDASKFFLRLNTRDGIQIGFDPIALVWDVGTWKPITQQFYSPPARWGLLDFMSVACSSPLLLLLLNRDPRRTVFSVGPQPRPSTPSVPCRTSTTTIPAQCSLPDLNHDHPRPVFPAGPQPRVSTPSVPCRTSCRKIWDKECAEES